MKVDADVHSTGPSSWIPAIEREDGRGHTMMRKPVEAADPK